MTRDLGTSKPAVLEAFVDDPLRLTPLIAECTFFPILPSSTEEVLRINECVAGELFYSKLCVHRKCVSCVRLCSTSTGVLISP